MLTLVLSCDEPGCAARQEFSEVNLAWTTDGRVSSLQDLVVSPHSTATGAAMDVDVGEIEAKGWRWHGGGGCTTWRSDEIAEAEGELPWTLRCPEHAGAAA